MNQQLVSPVDAAIVGLPFRPVQLPRKREQPDLPQAPQAPSSTSGDVPVVRSCQHHVDLKAFTGRGERRRLYKARSAVDKVHADMRRLVAITRSIKAKRLYLTLHARGQTGQLSLRWRHASAADARHIAWDDLGAVLSSLPADLAQWYRTVNVMAMVLNEQEKHHRAVLRHLQAMMRRERLGVAGAG